MTINNNSVEQINVALLDMDKKLKSTASKSASASDFKNLEASVDNIKRTLNETKTGLEPGKTYNINISGNAATADKAKEANKLVNALTVNGITYDGSEAVDAGVQEIENGGTGVTTQADINKAFVGALEEGESDVTDGTMFVSSYATDNGFADTDAFNVPFKRKFIKVWNYIKGKISSVLGLTKDNYGGKAATAGTADKAVSVVDYGDTSKTIKIGYTGAGATVDNLSHIAGYLSGGTQIKDVSKSVLQSWLGLSNYLPLSGGTVTGATQFNNYVKLNAWPGYGTGTANLWYDGNNKFVEIQNATDLKLSGVSVSKKGHKHSADDITSGVLPVANGGTGVTTQADINKAFIGNLEVDNSDVTDGTEFVSSWASDNGFADTSAVNTPYKRQFVKVWNYIKGKISSVLGLTASNYGGKSAKASFLDEYVGAGGTRLTSGNIKPKDASEYGGMRKDVVTSSMTDSGRPNMDGHLLTMFWDNSGRYDSQFFVQNSNSPAVKLRGKGNEADYGPWVDIITSNNIGSQTVATATTADNAKKLKPFASWQQQYVYDPTNGVRVNVYKITMASYFNSILIQIYDDINYAGCRRYILGLWHVSNYGYNVSVTDLGGTKANGLKVWMGTDGNVYLQADVYWTSRITFSYLDDPTDVTITKIGNARYGSNKDIDGNVLFTPLTDPITDCGVIRGAADLSSASKVTQYLNADLFTGNLKGTADKVANKLTINGQSFDGSSPLDINIYGAYDHVVYDDASLLEWANCTDGHMKKVLVKSGTYNMTKGVNLTRAGTGYVLAENGATIQSKVPVAFITSSVKTVIYNLSVVCDGASSPENSCAFSSADTLNLILYNCFATYNDGTVTVNRNLFSRCTCYNCHYNFTYSSSNSSLSMKVFYKCRCYNCKCKQTIEANSNVAISFNSESYFYKECHCSSCDAELTTSRNIKAATPFFSCYYNCHDRCVGCLSKINVNSKALTVYSTLYGFLRCQYMSSCKETHTEDYTNIKGIAQCDFISSTSGIHGESNTHVGNSCSIH